MYYIKLLVKFNHLIFLYYNQFKLQFVNIVLLNKQFIELFDVSFFYNVIVLKVVLFVIYLKSFDI